jgi:heparosan-N-sulfate-glucuronate 5-epimerase
MAGPTYPKRGATDPNFFSTAKSFPTELGRQITPGQVQSYYLDLRFKAEAPAWPPYWLAPRERQLFVATAQWALGCYDRYLMREGDEWLEAAFGAGRYLLEEQERGGPSDGAWLHLTRMRHTYLLDAPWISAMAQGECASVLVRLHKESGDDQFAEAAIKALLPMRKLSRAGGVRAVLDGGPFFEEYPTVPPSFVLNGGIFALWGLQDVAVGLGDEWAAANWSAGVETLARNIHRYDTGFWSRYDLFPHPIPNIASSAYHALHTTQLRATDLLAPHQELGDAVLRFDDYARSRRNRVRAFALKASFRMLVPRNHRVAHRLPWSEAQRQRPRQRRLRSPLVLCYHAVSLEWPASLAMPPDQFRRQLESLLGRGYRGVTFSEVVNGDAPRKALAVTFDDGFRSVLEHARPVLDELGIPATVFVPTAFVGGSEPMAWQGIDKWVGTPYEKELTCMSWDELRELQRAGWEVASHTNSHPWLPELDDDRLAEELVKSREACERELGHNSVTLAYPYGAHDERVRSAARDAGYAAAAALRPGAARRFRWPRIDLYPVDKQWRFGLKASPIVRALRSSRPGVFLEQRRQPMRRGS